MKKVFIFLISTLLMIEGCQRSQFAVTTRTSKNGRVTYANHYRNEQSQWAKVKTHKSRVKPNDAQNIPPDSKLHEILNLPGSEITRISPGSAYGQGSLLASNSKETIILAVNDNHLLPSDELNVSSERLSGFKTGTSFQDTTRRSKIQIDTAVMSPMVIRYKDGRTETARIISRSGDTLRYQLISEQGVIRDVRMDQVETIVPAPLTPAKSDSTTAMPGNNRKTEPAGIVALVFSFLGLVPVFGIPFALISIILATVSLGKIRRNPEKYYGKGVAIASMVIWGAGLIVYLALIFSGAFSR